MILILVFHHAWLSCKPKTDSADGVEAAISAIYLLQEKETLDKIETQPRQVRQLLQKEKFSKIGEKNNITKTGKT